MGLGPWPAVSLAEARKAPRRLEKRLRSFQKHDRSVSPKRRTAVLGRPHIRLQVSDFDSLGDLQGVFQLDAKIPDGAVHFRKAEKELNRP